MLYVILICKIINSALTFVKKILIIKSIVLFKKSFGVTSHCY